MGMWTGWCYRHSYRAVVRDVRRGVLEVRDEDQMGIDDQIGHKVQCSKRRPTKGEGEVTQDDERNQQPNVRLWTQDTDNESKW